MLSVVIVNWNTSKLLENCLASLSAGISRYNFETFVVDNGSSDGSQEMVRKLFPAVRLIENEKNIGFAAANNLALRQAKGDYFLLLNSDTVLPAGSIDILLDYATRHPEVGFASPQLLNEDGSIQHTIANFPSLATELLQKSILRWIFPQRYHSKRVTFSQPTEVETLVGACLLAKREMTEQIGFYDEDFFFFIEESEWCLRGAKVGWKAVLVPESEIYHLQGQSGKKVRIPVRIEYWRSRYTYFRKHYGAGANILLYSGLILRLGIDLILNSFGALFFKKSRHKVLVCLELFKWHLKGRPDSMGLSGS